MIATRQSSKRLVDDGVARAGADDGEVVVGHAAIVPDRTRRATDPASCDRTDAPGVVVDGRCREQWTLWLT